MGQLVDATPLTIAVEVDEYRPSLSVSGKADQDSISGVVSALDRLADDHDRCVSVDLGSLESIDAAALKHLASVAGSFIDRRKRLHLKSASRAVQHLLDKLLVSQLFCLQKECIHGCCPGNCNIACEHREMDFFTLPSSMENCHQARARVDEVAAAVGFDRCQRADVMLAVGEAVSNAIRHGRTNDGGCCFTVTCVASQEKLCVSVSDDGPGFRPDDAPPLSNNPLIEHGRGIHFMNTVMDEVSFHFDTGTTVRMVKNVSQG